MALDNNLDFNFNAADQAAIHTALDALMDLLNAPTVPYVNLTSEERKSPSIGPKRLPYVHDAVDNILPVFPNLASASIPLVRTTNLLGLVNFVQSITPKMMELNDRFTDMSINAENRVYKSMSDSYDLAVRHEGRMPGADVLIQAIAPLFANQGRKGSGPQPTTGDNNSAPTGDAATPPAGDAGNGTSSNS